MTFEEQKFVVAKSRKNYYFIAFIIGMLYFLVHFVLRSIITGTLMQTIDMWYIALDGLIVVIFIIKDTLDEISMQRGGSPVGSTVIEHTPFIAMVALHAVVIALTDPPSIYITLEWIFAVILLIDIIWDTSQDIRAGSKR